MPTVFLGGGTPSVLSGRSLDKIFAAIAPFVKRALAVEITVETNPEDVTDELLTRLRERGVNRLSVGIQSMDERAQRTLKRCKPATNTDALAKVRRHFENFSADILLGVPGGSMAAVKDTVAGVLEFQPPHLSVYCLEPGGVMEATLGDFFGTVDAEQSAREYLYVCGALAAAGYDHYEVSNFARPGYESRHNRAYWTGREYLGVGPGAHSYLDGRRFHNEPSIEAYVAGRDGFPESVRREEALGRTERELEELMLSLRTSRGLPCKRLEGHRTFADDLLAGGLARVDNGRFCLTDRGYLLLNEIVLRLTGHPTAA
jgi:oxygen-independent coproporphyrinogen-3 oxidase